MPAEIALPWIEPILPIESGWSTPCVDFHDADDNTFRLQPGMPCSAHAVRAILSLPRPAGARPMALPGQGAPTAVTLCLRVMQDAATQTLSAYADTLDLHELPALAPASQIQQSIVHHSPFRVMYLSAQVRNASPVVSAIHDAIIAWRRRHGVVFNGDAAHARDGRGHGTKPPPQFWPREVPSGVYVGFEFEAQFPSASSRAAALRSLWGMNDAMIRVQDDDEIRDRHLYIEADSSLRTPAAEIITMPHMIQQSSTYTALLRMFSCICAAGADNRNGNCGMHMHLSRTAFNRGEGAENSAQHPPPGTVAYTMSCLLDSAMAYLDGLPKFMAFTGRSQVSPYALPSQRMHERFRPLNFQNHPTVEFRFFGPYNFTKPEWPCIAHDIGLALLATARAVHAPDVSRPTAAMREHFRLRGPSSTMGAHALRCIGRIIESAPDLYPFAFEHFFVNPNTPCVFGE